MPLYEYTCRKCSKRFEAIVFGSKKPSCPKCDSKDLEKMISVFAVSTGSGKAAAALLAAGLFLLPACRPAPTDPADLSSRVPLDRWLDEHPAIAASIAWEET